MNLKKRKHFLKKKITFFSVFKLGKILLWFSFTIRHHDVFRPMFFENGLVEYGSRQLTPRKIALPPPNSIFFSLGQFSGHRGIYTLHKQDRKNSSVYNICCIFEDNNVFVANAKTSSWLYRLLRWNCQDKIYWVKRPKDQEPRAEIWDRVPRKKIKKYPN